jgi:hypothetical protein
MVGDAAVRAMYELDAAHARIASAVPAQVEEVPA